MRKLFPAFIFLVILSACSSEGTIPTGGGQNVPTSLIVGDTDQDGVNYRANSEDLTFTQTTVDGDSTFYEVSIDLDESGSSDLIFTLVRWTDFQILSVKGNNSMRIPFTDSDIEIIEIGELMAEAKLLINGTTIDATSASNYTSAQSGFISYTYQGEISPLSNQSLWNDKVYIPFVSGLVEGWIGIKINAGSNNEIQGIGVRTIAYRSF